MSPLFRSAIQPKSKAKSLTSQALFLAIILGVSFLAPGQSAGDSIIELQEVQVQARRIFEKETAGMKETRVDSLVIRQKLNLSLSDLLSENTPVYIKSHGRGALATASFRGTASSHTQVNWNGLNINSPMLGMVDFSLIPVYIIDDITLKHGGASVSDQSGGLGGSINIANRADWTNARQLTYIQGLGSYSSWDQFLMTAFGNSRIQWRSRLYYNRSENNYPFINRTKTDFINGQLIHPTDTNKHAAYSRYGTLQEFYWQPSHQHIVSVQWWGQVAKRGIPRVISFEGPDSTNISRQQDHDHKAVARWQWYGRKDNLTIRSGYTFKDLDYILTHHVSGTYPAAAIFSESIQQSFLQHIGYRREVTETLSLESAFNFGHHKVNTRDSVTQRGFKTRRNDLSMFFALHNQLHRRININLMIRQEFRENDFSPIIPFLGIDYLVTEKHPLVLKANIARNYRYPSLNDLYWVPGGNPELKPEKGFNTEVGFQHNRETTSINLKSEITIFRSDINDWIIWIPSFKGYWEPQNIRRVLSRGLETHATLSGELNQLQYRIMGSYTYTEAINYGDPDRWGDASYGKQLVFIPQHSGNVLFNVEYKGYAVSWQHNSYSERFLTSSNDISRRNRIYPYFMNDLSLAKGWDFEGWMLQTELKIYNLFNETYHTILYRPMPGRNLMVSIRIDLDERK
ncbi:MAG: TonB-dependent receptor [Bacteroidota bacterium]